MRTNIDPYYFDDSDHDEFDDLEGDELDVNRSDLMGYFHPREIVADQTLSLARKRALLAHWGSDVNAVRGAPAFRCSLAGVTTTIDATPGRSPVELRESQELRLKRLYPRTVIKAPTKQVLVPRPATARIGGKPVVGRELLAWAREFLTSILDV